MERLCKRVPIENPYAWDEAAKYDSMSVEMFARQNMTNAAAIDVIQEACRVALGLHLP